MLRTSTGQRLGQLARTLSTPWTRRARKKVTVEDEIAGILKDSSIRQVTNTEVHDLINDAIRWMIAVCVFVLLVMFLAVFVRLYALSRYIYYGPAIAVLVGLLVWRCLGNDELGSPLRIVAVTCALPGLIMVVFGAGATIMYWIGGEARGSILEARDMMHREPTPWSFYFSDGFVAHELATSIETCTHLNPKTHKQVRGRCLDYVVVPVFESRAEADAPNSSVRAWAVPMGMGSLMFDGTDRDTPSETCDSTKHGLGGLCGVSENQEIHEHAYVKRHDLISKFKSSNPHKVVVDDLPFMCFEDPHSQTSNVEYCWIVGVLLVLSALAITGFEVIQHCEEVGGSWYCFGRGDWTLMKASTSMSVGDSSSDESSS